MNPRQFYDLVVRMRELQKLTAQTRGFDRRVTKETKDCERAVDNEIARVRLLERENMQTRLDL